MTPEGLAHILFAVVSMLLGAGVFLLPKGTNLHRATGAAYVLAMFGLNVTALLIYRVFGGFGVFHVLALVSLVSVLSGFAAVLLRRPRKHWLRQHYYGMGWSYVGLMAAAVSEVTARVPGWPFFWAVAVPTALVSFAGGAIVQALVRRALSQVRIEPR